MERALRLAPVFASGRLLASSVASLPLQVYRQTGEQRQRLPSPSLFTAPSAQGTLHDWVFRAMTSLVYRGNAVGLITGRDRLEYPTSVEWLNPEYVQVIDSMPELGAPGSYTRPIWYYLGRVIPAEDLVHIPWFSVPGRVWGLSPLAAFAASVTTGLAAQDYSAEWFTNGGVPPGTFSNAAQEVDQADAEVIKQRLVQAIRTREPIVYGRDWQYTPISVSASEAKFVDTMRLTATQIANIYGIPPERIGGETGTSMTYQNVEQQSIEFVQFTLLPWLRKLEDAFSALLPRGQYVKFNADALIRSDILTRYATYEKARLIGLMSIDEIRALEDLPPLPNGQGADHTPLPLAAGTQITVPQVRGDEPGWPPRLIKEG